MNLEPAVSSTNVVQLLRREHAHVEERLRLLERNVSCVLEGDPLEVAEMLAVLRALHEYVDDVHQPREDAFLELVAAHALTPPAFVEELDRQHAHLHVVGARLVDHLERIAADVPVGRRDVEADLLSFLTAMRAHMALEETAFFPLAERVLRPSDLDFARIDDEMRRG
jgi:hemerythrin-like domain-containing protein